MALVGSHDDVSCAKCHPKSLLFKLKFAKPDFCGNCHKSPHDGQLFGKTPCEQCHSPAMGSLDKFQFDHDKRTRRRSARPTAAWSARSATPARSAGRARPAAETCHAADNEHGDRFKAFGTPQPACATCHASTPKWVATAFAHDRRTKFKLAGRHAEVGCRSCHRGRRARRLDTSST